MTPAAVNSVLKLSVSAAISLFGSLRLSGAKSKVSSLVTLAVMTETRAPTAAEAASAPPAPALSAAEDSVSKVVTTCIDTFSAFTAVAVSVVSKGLKVKRSTPSKPRAVATSAGVRPPCSINVVIGVTTEESSGAVSVKPPAG